jgi:hypothetical protein
VSERFIREFYFWINGYINGKENTLRIYNWIVLVIALVMFAGCGGKENRSRNSMKEALSIISASTEHCLFISREYSSAWERAINTGKPVEPAIREARKRLDEKKLPYWLGKERESIQKLMDETKNPPPELIPVHDELEKLFGLYTALYGLAVNPKGEYDQYVSSRNKLAGEIESLQDRLKERL